MKPVYRHLLALSRGQGSVFLAWRLLKTDQPDVGFDIERREPEGRWQRVTGAPVTDSTNWLDHTPKPCRYEYRVVAGGEPGEMVSVDSSAPTTNVVVSAPLRVPGSQCGPVCAGDLNGDGCTDFVVRCVDENRIMLDAYRSDGKPMWRIDTGLPARGGWDGSTHHCPFLLWDVDGDGRVEVAYHRRAEKVTDPEAFYDVAGAGETLAIADGQTGELIRETPWPATRPRVMMTVGHLHGIDEPPALVVLDETYGDVLLTAIDGRDGSTLWQVKQVRPAGHNLDVGDIDDDGKQEVICGGICYNGDGSVLWEAEHFGHTDISKPARIHPDYPGRQVFYAVESGNPGVYLVDNRGRTIFKEPFRHAHYGWLARHTDEFDGLQPHVAEDARSEYGAQDAGMRQARHNPVFLPDGSHWMNLTEWQRKNFCPVQWDAGARTVFIVRKEHRLVRLLDNGENPPLDEPDLPAGGRYGRNLLCLDVVGDYRENIVTVDVENDRLIVLANPELCHSRGLSPCTDFSYRHDRSQHGSGYYVYLAPPFMAS